MTSEKQKPTSPMTSSHVKAALRLHYAAPEYAILEEVRNATGRMKKRKGQQARIADMVAMGLWPSSGLEILGFEIKTSRSDWLKELSDEKKAVAISKFCDRWFLVTPNEKIVKEGELPEGWGWIVITPEYKVKFKVHAPVCEAASVTREFLASLLRNAVTSNPDYVEVQSRILEQQTLAAPAKRTRSAVKSARRKVTSVKASVKRLEKRKASDLSITMGLL